MSMEEGGFGIESGALGIRYLYISSCKRLVFPFIGFAHGEETTHQCQIGDKVLAQS
jgi:hypothetical protein